MKRTRLTLLSLVLVAAMLVSLSSCDRDPGTESSQPTSGSEQVDNGTYTYTDAVGVMAANWNPHTYRNADDRYPADYLRVGLYGFVFNDELHPVDGREAFEGYKIIPEMAASMPVDVTEKVKAEHPEFNIPESATKGYAYTIDLNQNAVWEDGTPINADTYVYSMQKLLDPELLNYRANDYYAGNFCVAGAEFYANQGREVTVAVSGVIKNEGLDGTIESFLAAHGDEVAYINYKYSFGVGYDFDAYPWDGMLKEEALTSDISDEIVETPLTLTQMYDFYVKAAVALVGVDEATAQAWFFDEVYCKWSYPDNIDFSKVGLYKTGDYQITLVLGKSLAGFNLLYSLTSNWIVHKDLYEANLKQTDGVWTSTYNTSVESTLSYGPYKLVSYQKDKEMRFEKNDKWYGYTDGQHKYVSPIDGKTYDMYQTTAITTSVVAEAETRKMMFLKGELMTYGLQADDFATYRDSDSAYVTPAETIFFFIFNGYLEKINEREAAQDFDATKYDLQTMTLTSFRKAIAVTYDKELFASTISPSRSGGYGLIGNAYLYDPDTGARYRDTDQAKQVLCDFYGIDVSKYSSLDEAVDAITGYDPELAKTLFAQAFEEAKAAGYITDSDNDGKSDQTLRIEYCSSETDKFITQTLAYLNEKLGEVLVGTPFEGKVEFYESAPYGTEWDSKIKSGLSDTVLAGWQGSALDPFGLTDQYVNPAYQYDAAWFDATSVELTLEVNVAGIDAETPEMKTLKMNLRQWSDALNGATVTIAAGENAGSYNFGDGIADVETRLTILAAIEGKVLQTYNYIPMLQDAGISLLTHKAYYVIDDYNPVMGRGGIAYLRYNYNDEAWSAYVAEQGGQLSY